MRILTTLGPASSDKDIIRALFNAGADVFRLNLNHGSREDRCKRYDIVRTVEAETGRLIGTLADIQGPKLHIGTLADRRVMLKNGDRFALDRDPTPGDVTRVYLPHPELYTAAAPGQSLSLDDGKIRLAIKAADPTVIVTRMVGGDLLSDRKGVNMPDAVIPILTFIEKDLHDLDFALSPGVGWIALSFMQYTGDAIATRETIDNRTGLLSKTEKPAALLHLGDIAQASGTLTVVHGDLGVKLPPERVPGMQKRILCMACQHSKLVVVVTQVPESMIEAPVPIRAETSDVTSAVYDGTDAVMLSAKSVSGRHPTAAVSIMNRIIVETGYNPLYRGLIDVQHQPLLPTCQDAVCAALCDVTHILGAVTTAIYTSSGKASLCTARERSLTPIVNITPRLDTVRRLAAARGVHSAISLDASNVDEMADAACRAAAREGFVASGDQIAITVSMPFGQTGPINLLCLAEIWPQTLVSAQTQTTALQPESATV